jgi:hypothetical protein
MKFLFSTYRWICIYPAYINSKKTLAEGRRIPKDKASVLYSTCNMNFNLRVNIYIVTDLLKALLYKRLLVPALCSSTVEACCTTVCRDHVIPRMT